VLPSHFAMPRCFCVASLIGLVLLLLGPLQAGPLPPSGVDDFKALIDPNRAPRPDPAAAGQTLADYRRKLNQAAQELPSLGEVARVLLMSEWASAELSPVAPVSLGQVRRVVLQTDDEAFQRGVQKLLADHSDDPGGVSEAIVAEIKRQVRLSLLKRLEDRTRFFLSQGQSTDRIAVANLISDTMNTSRRQDVSRFPTPGGGVVTGVMAGQDITPSSRSLRQRLRTLSGDLEKLISDPDTQVRVAGIRALSELEKEPSDLVALLTPLLAAQQSDAPTRQAAAEALGHVLEVNTMQIDKTRPEPYLKAVEQVLPAAAAGLADSDPRVRRASLEACQQAALILNELATERYYPAFRPTLAVVDSILPKLNIAARDRVPELRVGASHVLETFALTVQKMQHSKEGPAPGPKPSMERGKYKGQTLRPSPGVTVVSFSQPAAQAKGGKMADELPPPVLVEDTGLQETVQTMIENLRHPDYRVRLAAVDTLETFGKQAEAAIPALAAALRDPNKFVRWSSARTLGRLSPRRAEEVVPGLMRLLDDREDPSVRVAAAKALELYGEHAKKAVPLLARVINRGDKDYIIAILHTIQGIGTDAAPTLPNVAWILSDRTQPPSVRKEAAQTLGRFGPLAKGQLPTLREVMNNDPDEEVRNAASTAVLAVNRPLR